MKIEDFVNLSLLLDTYGALLTEKEQTVLDMYVNANMSYLEIANELCITKTAVMCFIKSAEEKLLKYESVLQLAKIKKMLLKANQKSDVLEIKSIISSILKGDM